MADIICARCGEPWDCTGGLHHSHTDLCEEDFEALLHGGGCPSCTSNLQGLADDPNDAAYDPENITRWQRSVERLSEGEGDYLYYTFETPPDRTGNAFSPSMTCDATTSGIEEVFYAENIGSTDPIVNQNQEAEIYVDMMPPCDVPGDADYIEIEDNV